MTWIFKVLFITLLEVYKSQCARKKNIGIRKDANMDEIEMTKDELY